MGLVLIQNGKSGVLHQLAVQLLELLQRILVVLTGALRQDIHPKVCISDLFFVVLLVGRRELISLPLKFLLLQEQSAENARKRVIISKSFNGGYRILRLGEYLNSNRFQSLSK